MGISSLQVERRHNLPRIACRLWAGLACGMLAGALSVAWFALHSLMRGEFWWAKFNVAAGWFYAMAVYHAGLSWVTLCGASVIVLIFCVAGVLYALGWEALFRRRAFLTTALYVIAIFVFEAYFIWPSLGPFARLWFPWSATLPAHIALFATLARFPESYVRLVNDFGDTAWLQPLYPEPPARMAETQPHDGGFEAPGDASSSAESAKD